MSYRYLSITIHDNDFSLDLRDLGETLVNHFDFNEVNLNYFKSTLFFNTVTSSLDKIIENNRLWKSFSSACWEATRLGQKSSLPSSLNIANSYQQYIEKNLEIKFLTIEERESLFLWGNMEYLLIDLETNQIGIN